MPGSPANHMSFPDSDTAAMVRPSNGTAKPYSVIMGFPTGAPPTTSCQFGSMAGSSACSAGAVVLLAVLVVALLVVLAVVLLVVFCAKIRGF